LNYLAHLYLADDDPESVIGSLMGDFVKGRIGDELAPAVRWAVLVHRRVDSFTDAHPVVKRGKCRMRPEYRRYAGILLDLFYDHFLAVKWSRYSPLPLEDFARRVYRILQTNQCAITAPMQRSMNYMVSNELLQSYREIAGIAHALRGIEKRLKRPSRLSGAIVELRVNYRDLEEDFVEFFPELTRYTQQLNLSRDRGPPDF
jgi:acyl carrier protein phosphodiesterase